ncbi:hypothetical protein ACLPJK_26215 [Pseudomonas aeruginosa]|uniref:hypothetical protein n=1 Tax=Pseudomonas aeruginosa TaxID=287 RepID=UPI003D296B20
MDDRSRNIDQSIFDELEQLGKSDIKRITEADFIDHVIPIIMSRARGEEVVDLTALVNVAGSPNSPLHVVDNGNTQILFTIPPILAVTPLAVLANPASSVNANHAYEALSLYHGHMRNGDELSADRALLSGLGPLIGNAQQSTALDYLKTWIPIYRRYNLPISTLLGLSDEVVEKMVAATPGADGDSSKKPSTSNGQGQLGDEIYDL